MDYNKIQSLTLDSFYPIVWELGGESWYKVFPAAKIIFDEFVKNPDEFSIILQDLNIPYNQYDMNLVYNMILADNVYLVQNGYREKFDRKVDEIRYKKAAQYVSSIANIIKYLYQNNYDQQVLQRLQQQNPDLPLQQKQGQLVPGSDSFVLVDQRIPTPSTEGKETPKKEFPIGWAIGGGVALIVIIITIIFLAKKKK